MSIFYEIRRALDTLGYKGVFNMDDDPVVIKKVSLDRYRVEYRGEYMGIWDSIKKTFVD